jgi:hypothetical protein
MLVLAHCRRDLKMYTALLLLGFLVSTVVVPYADGKTLLTIFLQIIFDRVNENVHLFIT